MTPSEFTGFGEHLPTRRTARPMVTTSPQLDPPTIVFPGPINPPAATPSHDPAEILHHERLSAVLRGVAEGLGVAAAELHLLDDQSANLQLVATDRQADCDGQPRSLSRARADVAAMAGGAVVLEDARMVTEWQADPVGGESCEAAVCVPVASDTTIHGTLWLRSESAREFTDAELQLVEIAAGRLAVEIERRQLLDEPAEASRATVEARLPAPTTPCDLGELEFAGWSTDAADAVAVHDWMTLSDGRLLIFAAAVVDTPGGTKGAALLAAQAARIAARCHAEALPAGSTDAGRVMTQVSHSIWQATPGGEGVSIALAIVDPHACAGAYALAGGGALFAVRASHTQTESTEAPPAGWDQNEIYASHAFELSLRERFVLTALDMRQATPRGVDQLADTYRSQARETHQRMTAERAIGVMSNQVEPPHSAVALRWR